MSEEISERTDKVNDVIKINYENERPTVMGRQLHEALGVETRYNDWFKRMTEYGFSEGTDFYSILSKTIDGGRPSTDHQLTIEMAKEICMLQRSDKGKQCRQYFIQLEKAWNTPEAVMSRALQMADKHIQQLKTTVAVQEQQIQELQPKASYYDLILNCKDLMATSVIAKDYGKSAAWLNNYLHDKGVQYKQGEIWLLYQKHSGNGYTSTKTHSVTCSDGLQHNKVHTYWTQKGRIFIYQLLSADGILPLIEMS